MLGYFCGSVGTGLSMCLARIGVRSCTSESPHIPHKRKLFGSCCCSDVRILSMERIRSSHLASMQRSRERERERDG